MANKVEDGHYETKYGEIFISPKVTTDSAATSNAPTPATATFFFFMKTPPSNISIFILNVF